MTECAVTSRSRTLRSANGDARHLNDQLWNSSQTIEIASDRSGEATVSGVTTGEWVGPDPPTSVQTPPEICTNPLKSVLYIGGPMHVHCNFLLLTSKEKLLRPPLWAGDATGDGASTVASSMVVMSM